MEGVAGGNRFTAAPVAVYSATGTPPYGDSFDCNRNIHGQQMEWIQFWQSNVVQFIANGAAAKRARNTNCSQAYINTRTNKQPRSRAG